MIILLITFGSVLAMGLPLVVAFFGIGVGLAQFTLLDLRAEHAAVRSTAGVDDWYWCWYRYTVFIVTRYRHELHEGAMPVRVNTVALNTAGRAVLFAGIIVVISMLGRS